MDEVSYVLMGRIDTLLDYCTLPHEDIKQIREEIIFYNESDALLVLDHIQKHIQEDLQRKTQTDLIYELKRRIEIESYYER